MILEAKKISKSYSKNQSKINILKNIDFKIYKGEISVIVGPSGSGKSSLLNILGTLDLDFTGDLFIDKIKIKSSMELSDIRKNKIGFIFQFHHLLPEFTIFENILIPQILKNKNIKHAEKDSIEMLKLFNLYDRINHYPSEVSGGERQRVAALRAIANKPLVVVADEPTGNLDKKNSKIMLELILDLKENYNQSFIIATHDEEIVNIADSVYHIENGLLIKDIR